MKSGQTLSEYSLIAALVLLVAIGALKYLGQNIAVTTEDIIPKRSSQANALLPASQKPAAAGGAVQNTPVVTNAAAPENPALSAIVEVSGSNGNQKAVYNNSALIMAVANRYTADTDTYNMIIQLGQKGQTLAGALADNASLENEDVHFGVLYAITRDSADFQKLSPADQGIIMNLASENQRISKLVLSGAAPATSENAAAVFNNSTEIKQCGENSACAL